MKRRLLSALVVLSLIASLSAVDRAEAGETAADYIVVFRDHTDVHAKTSALERRHGFTSAFRYTSALRGFAARLTSAAADQLARDPEVLFVSPDGPVHALGGPSAAAVKPPKVQPPQSVPNGISRIEALKASRAVADNAAINVAIIDSGIDTAHPDLRVVGGKNCSTGVGFDDLNGHGTHVAGTVAALNNAIGVVGVLPGASLWAVRVLDRAGAGTLSATLCGVDFVTANASIIKVANMSLGGAGSNDGNCGLTNNDALHRAICRSVAAGVTYVVAAGNSAADFSSQVPAAYDEVLTVTAVADYDGRPGGASAATCASLGADDSAATFSNFATTPANADHTIAGPGVCILSTWKGGSYNTLSGTSMATPHVTGTAALCIADGACAGLAPRQVISKLRADAQAHSITAATPYYGFAGDPNLSSGARYYGHLVWAGGY